MITYRDFTLSFQLRSDTSAMTAQAVVQEAQRAESEASVNASAGKTVSQKSAVELPNQAASVSYKNILPSVDIQYQISGKRLKEYLVFDAPPTQPAFSYTLTYTGLEPAVQESGAVHFYAPDSDTESPIFIIAAPYMFDATDSHCSNVAVSLTPTSTGSIYTLTPDSEWLNSPERVYPVTLDPTVTTSTSAADIEDNCVHQANPAMNYITADRMYVGSEIQNSSAYESRIYIRFPRVSAIPTSAFIRNATMYLDHYPTSAWQTAVNNTIDVYEVGGYNWNTSTITWNSQAGYAFSNRITSRVTDKSYSTESFDVTSLVQKWYRTTASNNGLVIKPRTLDTAKTNRTCFYSSDCSSSYAAKRPRITIEYYTGSPVSGITSNGIYFIRSVYSGKYIDVRNSGGVNTDVLQYSFNGGKNQQWQVKYHGGGVYSFIPQHNTALRLDVPNGLDSSGLNMQVYSFNNAKAQLFRIYSNGDSYGSYRIMPLCSSTRVLDIEGPSTADAAPIQIWTWSGSNQMRWCFEKVDYGNAPRYTDIATSAGMHMNCAGFALRINGYLSGSILGVSSGASVETVADKTLTYFYANCPNRSIRRIPGVNLAPTYPIYSNEYRVALRVVNGVPYDYHFMIQTSDGDWAHKPGNLASESLGLINPSTYNWAYDYGGSTGVRNYNSDVIYFAVTR